MSEFFVVNSKYRLDGKNRSTKELLRTCRYYPVYNAICG